MASVEQVEEALKNVNDPHLEKSLVAAKAVKDIQVDNGKVTIDISLGYPAKSLREELASQINDAVNSLEGVEELDVIVGWDIQAHSVQKSLKPMENIKNVIAVASGKGGVGKSTTAVNLALALAAEGATVGMLDADIYGPSQPRMLGVSGQPESSDGKSLEPMEAHGLSLIHI